MGALCLLGESPYTKVDDLSIIDKTSRTEPAHLVRDQALPSHLK
jgi:hypothetical protein